MSQDNPLFTAPRLTPKQSFSSPAAPPRSPIRAAAALDYGTFYRDLSPTKTLHALDASIDAGSDNLRNADQLIKALAGAPNSEKAFARKVAKTSKSLKEWCRELESWPWDGGFDSTVSAISARLDAQSANVTESQINDSDAHGKLAAQVIGESAGDISPATAAAYEERIQLIKDALDALGIEEQKAYVLKYHVPDQSISKPPEPQTPTSPKDFNQLDDLTALVTAILMQALPHYSKLMSLLTVWSVRLSILKQITPFVIALRKAKFDLRTAFSAILDPEATAKVPLQRPPDGRSQTTVTKDQIKEMRANLDVKVADVGRRLDSMLDILDGHDEVLPNDLIDTVDDLEFQYSNWTIEAEQCIAEAEKRCETLTEPVVDLSTAAGEIHSDIAAAEAPEYLDSISDHQLEHDEQTIPRSAPLSYEEPNFHSSPEMSQRESMEIIPPVLHSSAMRDGLDDDDESVSDWNQNKLSLESRPTEQTPDLSLRTSEDTLYTPEPPHQNRFSGFKFVDDPLLDEEFNPETNELTAHADVRSARVYDETIYYSSAKDFARLEESGETDANTPRAITTDIANLHPTSPSWRGSFFTASDDDAAPSIPSWDDLSASSARTSYNNASMALIESFSRGEVKRVQVARRSSFPSRESYVAKGHRREESNTSERSFSTEALDLDRVPLRQPDWQLSRSSESRMDAILSLHEPLRDSKSFRISRLIDCFASPDQPEKSVEFSESYSTAKQEGTALDDLQKLLSSSPVPDSDDAEDDDVPLAIEDENDSDDNSDISFGEESESDTEQWPSPSPSGSETRDSSTPPTRLEKQIDMILSQVPVRIQLKKRQANGNAAGKSDSSSTSMPIAKTRTSSSSGRDTPAISLVPVSVNDGNKQSGKDASAIKLYHLTQVGKPPVKLFVRLVGEGGERVMVRVGGGWADLEEYLREYAAHHRAEKMTFSGPSRLRNVTAPAVTRSKTPRPARQTSQPSTPASEPRPQTASPAPAPSSGAARSKIPTIVTSSPAEDQDAGGLAGPRKRRELTVEKQKWLDEMITSAKKWKAEKDSRERGALPAGLEDMGAAGSTRRLYRTSDIFRPVEGDF